jgi:hypothetical protein
MPELPVTGACMCGAVRFEVTEPFTAASYCHCTRCQRRTGSAASAQARVEPGSVTITSGEELVRSYRPEDGFAKDFCSGCGSALFSRNPETGEIFSVRLGVLDEPPAIRPQWHQFVDFAAPWEPLPDDGLPRHGGSPRR